MTFTLPRLLMIALLSCTPMLAQQLTSQQTAPSLTGDPTAGTVVQSAIQAMGGAVGTAQPQTVTFQGSMEGPLGNGNANFTIRLYARQGISPLDAAILKADVTHRPFVAAAASYLLFQEMQHSKGSLQSVGPITIGSNTVKAISLSVGAKNAAGQTCYFNNDTGLPVRLEVQVPSVGASGSSLRVFDFSDYRNVSGVMYPFRISLRAEGQQTAEIITLESITPNFSALPNVPSRGATSSPQTGPPRQQ